MLIDIGTSRFDPESASVAFQMASSSCIESRIRSGCNPEIAALTITECRALEIERQFFGMHLTLDAFHASNSAISSLDSVFDFLDKLPEKVGMRKISQPHVFHYDGGYDRSESGITGSVILATSHASFHSFPKKDRFFSMDLYSCKPFNPAAVLMEARTAFSFSDHYSIKVFLRGPGYPRTW